jgi:hypothetical protein
MKNKILNTLREAVYVFEKYTAPRRRRPPDFMHAFASFRLQ